LLLVRGGCGLDVAPGLSRHGGVDRACAPRAGLRPGLGPPEGTHRADRVACQPGQADARSFTEPSRDALVNSRLQLRVRAASSSYRHSTFLVAARS
jgi:hypothetical protein